MIYVLIWGFECTVHYVGISWGLYTVIKTVKVNLGRSF